MKRIIKLLSINLIIFMSLIFCSCDGYAKLQLEKSGAVSFGFVGNLGNAFQDMISSVGEDVTIDEEGIATELVNAGFANVKVAAKNQNIMISFTDETRDSYLFESGIVSVKNDDIKLSITPANFLKLYNAAGEDIQMLLDLFISPVLNDEVMTEEEYVDTIAVTYGEDAGKEIDESSVYFSVVNSKGKEKKKSIFAKSILCGIDVSF